MSIKVMSEVWDKSQHKANPLLTLLALADNANDDGYCWPGIEKIAKKTRVSSSTVIRCIKKLEDTAEVFAVHNRRFGNKYIVLIGKSDESIEDVLKTYFRMSAQYVQESMDIIKARRVKCQIATNGSNCQIDTSDIAPVQHENLHSCAISDIAPVQHDPSKNHQRTVNSVALQEPPKAERDAIFDALALHVFKAEKGTPAYDASIVRAVKLGWWCVGRDMEVGRKPDKRTIAGCNLPVTPRHVEQWAQSWDGDRLPSTPEKFVQHFYEWLVKQSIAPAPQASTTTSHATREALGLVD